MFAAVFSFLCPLPRTHLSTSPFVLPLYLLVSDSRGSAIVLVIAEEHTGVLCQCV